MPHDRQNWSVANIFFDGEKSTLTTYKSWHSSTPVFRSWIMHKENPIGYPLPEPLYAIREYYHAKVNPTYFKSQRALQALQGKHNLWIAGLYMHDVDSHDSALISAISIAKLLAPQAERLLPFLGLLD